MRKIYILLLPVLLLISCNGNNNPKFAKPNNIDTNCWITFEGKKFYIGEDLASIEKKIEIKKFLEIYPNEGKYISPSKDVLFPEVTWIRSLNWTFDKNLKLQEIHYSMTASISEGYIDDDKYYTRFYQYVDSIQNQNKCNSPKINYSGDYYKTIDLEWKKRSKIDEQSNDKQQYFLM